MNTEIKSEIKKGRPKKSEKDRRVTINISLYSADLKILDSFAKKNQMSRSLMFRQILNEIRRKYD